MPLERGFRRLVIIGSVAVLGLGITFDVIMMTPHATVRVDTSDGRHLTIERHGPKALLMDPHEVTRDAEAQRLLRPTEIRGAKAWSVEREGEKIVDVQVIRGPEYRWWTDAEFTRVAAVLVALLWACFYAVRWIARGFTGSPS